VVFWFLMLLTALLCPAIMLIFGRLMWKHPPKFGNSYYGYRTRRSQADPDAWLFAHVYFGRIWWQWGILVLPLSVLAMIPALPLFGRSEDFIGIYSSALVTVQCLVICIPIILTERQLKRHFPQNG